MSTLQVKQDVGVEDVQRTLTEALGPKFRVTATSGSVVKVGRTGVVPSQVRVNPANGMTTLKINTTGLILSRLAQAIWVNPSVRRALEQAYPRARS
jgi:hypothetical protein